MLERQDKTLDRATYYCAGCGSDRIAGAVLVPLNDRPGDMPGTWIPTVSQEEIEAIPKVIASRYWYYCFDCAQAKDMPPSKDPGTLH